VGRVERGLRGCFVTGTDTGVGKTVLAAAIVASLRSRGVAVRACKPVITGLEERPDPDWPPDHELLAGVTGSSSDEVALVRYGPPVSPHLAAELAGHSVALDQLCDAVRAVGRDADAIVVEGVGGLLVPITDAYDVRALAKALGLPLVIAARPGLGTLNHTLLTIESARSHGLEPAGVVLTPWPEDPSPIERSNLATIERLGGVRVATLARVLRPDSAQLAAAGRALPVDEWLGNVVACQAVPAQASPHC
jgi:dethiobiotin synthetase